MSFPGFVRCHARLGTAAAAFAAAGCASGSSTETPNCTTDCSTGTPTATAGTVGVSVAPITLEVAPGDTGVAVVTVSRGGTFTGPVTLTAYRVPPGLAVIFDPNPVPPAFTTSIVSAVSMQSRPEPPPAGARRLSPPGISLIRSRHAIPIKADGDNVSASTTLTVLCASSCEAPQARRLPAISRPQPPGNSSGRPR